MTTQLDLGTLDAGTLDPGTLGSLLAGLASDLVGRVHLPGSPSYAALATPWNLAVSSHPVAVVEATSAQDVATAIRAAAAAGVQVSVQATGHGAVEHAGPELLISTRRLHELTVTASGAVRAGAGVVWREVIDAAAPLGFAALAGSAPGVGVVGFLTGGGLGPVARTYGVSADYVTAFDVVTGDGQIRRATATENPGLFWGLRGGKGALGIVTAVDFDLVPLAGVFGGCVFFDGADAAAVLHTWRQWTATLTEQATTSLAVMRLPAVPGVPEPLAGRVTVAVRFAWVGDEAEGLQALTGIITAGRVIFGGVGPMPYTAIGDIHNDPVDPMPTTESSTLLQSLPAEAVEALLRLVDADASCPQLLVELRHLGGAIGREQGGASAFDHRSAAYSLITIGIAAPPLVDNTRAHAAALMSALAPWSDGTCLPNFQATNEPAEIARKYTTETLAQLAALSNSYDPDGVIALGDAIRAAARIGR